MTKKFTFLEHMADVYIEAYGNTLEELFENSAIAMFEVMTDTSKVKPIEVKSVKTDGFDLESLLYCWLEEWLIIHDSENMVFSKFKVNTIKKVNEEEYVIEGYGWGEKFNPRVHEVRTEVKAVTYHMMEIKQINGKWIARFLLDI